MKLGGYMGKILYVDLTTRLVSTKNLEEAVAKRFLGGSGLGTKILLEETTHFTEPFSEDNVIIFSTGPLTGTGLFNSDRFSVVTKSPLTGIFSESSAGGYWGSKFKRCGFDTLIIKGKANSPVYLAISNDSCKIMDASHLWGLDTFEATDLLKDMWGQAARAAIIGPAGENKVPFACIISDGKHGRVVGRCGAGAVMGSKNLKAVVVNGTKKIEIVNREAIKNVNEILSKNIRQNMKGMEYYGTSGGLEGSHDLGNLPIKNFSLGVWKEGAQKTNGIALAETLLKGAYHCGSCMINCGRIVVAKGGKYDKQEIAGPEYETMALMGGNLLNDNLESIIKANELCNRYGLDTISTGGVIAFAMEAWEKGLIDSNFTNGMEIKWGNKEVILSLIQLIGENRDLGEFLGKGVKQMAKEIGGIAHEFAIEVKGLELPAHDGRAKHTAALGMATSARGGCHLSAFAHDFEEGATIKDLGVPPLTDRFDKEGKALFTVLMQNLMGVFDSATICKFALHAGITVEPLVEAINATTGWNLDTVELFQIGERIFNAKRIYNMKNGISRKDDTLPVRMLRQRKEGGSNQLPPLDEMIGEYYDYRGWDEFGCPSQSKVTQLGLEEYF